MQLVDMRFYSWIVPAIFRQGGMIIYEKDVFLLMSSTGYIKILDKKCLEFRDIVLYED